MDVVLSESVSVPGIACPDEKLARAIIVKRIRRKFLRHLRADDNNCCIFIESLLALRACL
jgi:hypothetical protein